jgi:hypothetical protein
MARLSQHDRAVRRSGVVLLIVMAMLALFAVVGLTFVFYAESESDASRLRRQAEGGDGSDILSEKLLTYALGQLIFDTNNPNSKIRGHSLGRSIYGASSGTIPFNGLGRPHPDTQTQLAALTPFDGVNVPYTYPDLNNSFLATLDANGNIVERSFYRNGGSLRPATLAPTNPQDPGEGDVRSSDSFQSVLKNNQAKYFNDAFWMDLDYPIVTAKDGTRWKPLFAFTVLDLDSRLNLAVVGNFQADYTGQGPTSRCGLGVFEINPAKVLTVNRLEITKLFRGSTTAPSRFGSAANDVPDRSKGLSFPPTKFYSRVDYSGVSSDKPGPPAPLSQFPTFGGWNDPPAGTPHAAAFDYFHSRTAVNPTDDVRLAPSNTEAILRWRDRGSPALTSDLYRLLYDNLNTQRPGAAQILNLITPYSMSLDTAHIAPFIYGDRSGGQQRYELQDGPNAGPAGALTVVNPHPKTNLMTQIIPTNAAVSAGTGDDFTAGFRGRAAAELRRLNLNRGMSTPQDRIAMAKEIFARLVRVTGAPMPAPAAPFQPANAADSQYKATRWLAQLAVNMVDFMDDDDNNMTVFCWNPKSDPKSQEEGDYVVGIEMNRLLINEVYATFDNDKDDAEPRGAPINATKYRINAWAELYNPMNNAVSGQGVATLVAPALMTKTNQPRYRLLLAKSPAGIAESPTGMPSALHYDDPNDPNQGVVDWTINKNVVLPGDQSPAGNGFFLVGPPEETLLPDRKPTWTVKWDHTSRGMSSKLYPLPGNEKEDPKETATLVLQRLANPNADQQLDPRQPNYNPFITVDYFPGITPKSSIKYTGTQTKQLNKFDGFKSKGRIQPLQASLPKDQNNPAADPTGQEPEHSFSKQNVSRKQRFDPLYHLDRALISSAEIFSAPTVPPSLVTQRFPGSYSAFEVSKDPNSLLFRFLETVTVGDRMFNQQLDIYNRTGGAGQQAGVPLPPSLPAGAGRPAVFVPGKININICDKKLIEAIFDRQNNSSFSDADVDTFWNELKAIRDTRAIAGFSDYTLAPPDKNGSMRITLHNTFFESPGFNGGLPPDPNQRPGLFQKMFQSSTATSEYEKTESLRKVMNNITFTSNAFAVWVTVGFFEVDAANQVTQEIGKSENRHVRHRMFAIVDRSQLVLPDQQLTTLAAPSNKITPAIMVAATSGSYAPNFGSPNAPARVDYPNWNITAGTPLTIDKDLPTEETVTAARVNGNTLEVSQPLRFDHVAGATIHLAGIRGPQVPINAAAASAGVSYMLGYAGPQPRFNMREYTYVVPYYSIID